MSKYRVQILEDDWDIVDLVASALGDRFECCAAANGHDGLLLAQRALPDLILCDIMMPVMDGYELLRRLRRMPGFEQTPVVFLTALSSKDQIRQGYSLGADLYLTKPIDPTRLRRNIELFLEDRRILPRTDRPALAEVLEADVGGLASRAQPSAGPVYRGEPASLSGGLRATGAGPIPVARLSRPPSTPGPGRPSQPATLKVRRPTERAAWRIRILVAASDRDTLQHICSALSLNFELIEARDGVTALELAVRYKPDVFIVDAQLARMTGYQLAMMLRRNSDFYRSPIILLSSKSGPREEQYARRMGASHLLPNPAPARLVLEAVDQAISDPGFSVRTDRLSVNQAHLEQLQHFETHRTDSPPRQD